MQDAGYASLRMFNQVLKTCNEFPADSYGKVVLCGNSGAGKSTLTQVKCSMAWSRFYLQNWMFSVTQCKLSTV